MLREGADPGFILMRESLQSRESAPGPQSQEPATAKKPRIEAMSTQMYYQIDSVTAPQCWSIIDEIGAEGQKQSHIISVGDLTNRLDVMDGKIDQIDSNVESIQNSCSQSL